MKTKLLILIFTVCQIANAQIKFQKDFPTTTTNITHMPQFGSAKQTSDGGYIICGANTGGSSSFGALLIKTNSLGDTLWTKCYGSFNFGGLPTSARDVIQTSDGGYAFVGHIQSNPGIGVGSSQVYLVKTNSNGDTLWTKHFGDTTYVGMSDQNEQGWTIKQTNDQGFILGASTSSNDPVINSNKEDLYIIKTNSSGNPAWAKTYTNLNKYGGMAGVNVKQTLDGGYMAITTTVTLPSYLTAVYLVKIKSNGDTLWTRTYGGLNYEEAYTFAQTADSGYVIPGAIWDSVALYYDSYVFKVDKNGNPIWAKSYGGQKDDWFGSYYSEGIADAGNGFLVLSGYTKSFTTDSTSDIFVVKINSTNGDTIWTKTYGKSGVDESSSFGTPISSTLDGGFIVTTSYYISTLVRGESLIKITSNGNSACNQGQPSPQIKNLSLPLVTNPSYPIIPINYQSSYGVKVYNDSIWINNVCNGCDSIVGNNFTYVDSSLTVNFSDTISGATSWFWNFGDGNTSTIQNPTHTYSTSGTYTVCLSVSNICNADTICGTVTVSPLNVNNYSDSQFAIKIFPNPFSSSTTFQTDNIFKDATLTVYNLYGQTVKQIKNISGQTVVFSRDNLASGLYFVRLSQDGKNIAINKLVITD